MAALKQPAQFYKIPEINTIFAVMKKEIHPARVPFMLYADRHGHILEDRNYEVCGRSGHSIVKLKPEDFIPLPQGSELFFLPGRHPYGYSRKSGELELFEKGLAVSAFASPAYTQTFLAAYHTPAEEKILPLYAYTAVGWLDGKFWVCMLRIDADQRQDFINFDCDLIEQRTLKQMKRFPENRLIRHLGKNCSLNYGCPAARNYFMGRWEAPVPTSPACNARCLGCISHQPEESGIPSTQLRLNFVPEVREIVELMVPHLEKAPKAIASFGQGCEGEPLLVWEVIRDAIKEVRKKTSKGIINLNTNASKPEAVDALFSAGLDSIRISMNSVQKVFYERYFNPVNYSFEQVRESAMLADKHNKWSSINYFTLPGMTDMPEEVVALKSFIAQTNISMIQWRNFNIDPDWYFRQAGLLNAPAGTGIPRLVSDIRKSFPNVYHGYYNPPLEIQHKYKPPRP